MHSQSAMSNRMHCPPNVYFRGSTTGSRRTSVRIEWLFNPSTFYLRVFDERCRRIKTRSLNTSDGIGCTTRRRPKCQSTANVGHLYVNIERTFAMMIASAKQLPRELIYHNSVEFLDRYLFKLNRCYVRKHRGMTLLFAAFLPCDKFLNGDSVAWVQSICFERY